MAVQVDGEVVSETLRLSYSDNISKRAELSSTLSQGSGRSVAVAPAKDDDLARNVYGFLGLSFDSVDFASLLGSIEAAVRTKSPFLISTPNVNFLVTSQRSSEFRESVLLSNLCLVDGMPLIWIAKLLQIPTMERIAGSDLFGRLKSTVGKVRPMKVFLLGGADGVADTVCAKLNAEKCGLECVGVHNPGFGTIEEMSSDTIIEAINSARPDLLAVFFGAEKAQAWLMHNHHRLQVPVRAQFGATINFEAGIVKRAPHFLRSTGFEWLWRIKEEPYLWRRYWNDGKVLFELLLTCILPLVIETRWKRPRPEDLRFSVHEAHQTCTVELSGDATGAHIDLAIGQFRRILDTGLDVAVDIAKVRRIDPRFFGLILMVRKHLARNGRTLNFTGLSHRTRRIFRLNKFEFLLSPECVTGRV